jgi:uncharacterized caspase-like protein
VRRTQSGGEARRKTGRKAGRQACCQTGGEARCQTETGCQQAQPAPDPTPEPTPTPEPAKTWALLVGVSDYQNPAITDLKYAAADATGLHKALTDPTLGNLPASQVKMLVDSEATTANIMGAVETFLKPNVKAGDKVLVFLAGHGVAKGVGAIGQELLHLT